MEPHRSDARERGAGSPQRAFITLLLAMAGVTAFAWGVEWINGSIAAAGLLCLPLVFAGIIFAASLRRCESLPSAFSSNLMGAILGGLCEYASMVLGFRTLYFVASALYAISWVCVVVRGRTSTSGAICS